MQLLSDLVDAEKAYRMMRPTQSSKPMSIQELEAANRVVELYNQLFNYQVRLTAPQGCWFAAEVPRNGSHKPEVNLWSMSSLDDMQEGKVVMLVSDPKVKLAEGDSLHLIGGHALVLATSPRELRLVSIPRLILDKSEVLSA